MAWSADFVFGSHMLTPVKLYVPSGGDWILFGSIHSVAYEQTVLLHRPGSILVDSLHVGAVLAFENL